MKKNLIIFSDLTDAQIDLIEELKSQPNIDIKSICSKTANAEKKDKAIERLKCNFIHEDQLFLNRKNLKKQTQWISIDAALIDKVSTHFPILNQLISYEFLNADLTSVKSRNPLINDILEFWLNLFEFNKVNVVLDIGNHSSLNNYAARIIGEHLGIVCCTLEELKINSPQGETLDKQYFIHTDIYQKSKNTLVKSSPINTAHSLKDDSKIRKSTNLRNYQKLKIENYFETKNIIISKTNPLTRLKNLINKLIDLKKGRFWYGKNSQDLENATSKLFIINNAFDPQTYAFNYSQYLECREMIEVLSNKVPEHWELYYFEQENNFTPSLPMHLIRSKNYFENLKHHSNGRLKFLKQNSGLELLLDECDAIAMNSDASVDKILHLKKPIILFNSSLHADNNSVFEIKNDDDIVTAMSKISSNDKSSQPEEAHNTFLKISDYQDYIALLSGLVNQAMKKS